VAENSSSRQLLFSLPLSPKAQGASEVAADLAARLKVLPDEWKWLSMGSKSSGIEWEFANDI